MNAIPAATVVLLRDTPGGGEVECLMLHKNRGQTFGGMWVFPGGAVEPGDEVPGAEERDDARRAAVREAAEETGLALDPADLVPFAHWVPPLETPKRYSTWFFVAALPPGAVEVIVDGGEIGDHVWTTPGTALQRHAAGEIELAPPTWVTLHSMVGATDAAEVVSRLGREPVDFFTTRIARHQGELVALWEPDAGYESGDLDRPGPRHRLHMAPDGGWRYERSA